MRLSSTNTIEWWITDRNVKVDIHSHNAVSLHTLVFTEVPLEQRHAMS